MFDAEFFSGAGEVFSAGEEVFSDSSGSLSVAESAACALRNSRKPLPIARPTSGSLLGPKTISPTIKITMNSPAPIPNIAITPKIFRGDYIMYGILFKHFSEKKPNAILTKAGSYDKNFGA